MSDASPIGGDCPHGVQYGADCVQCESEAAQLGVHPEYHRGRSHEAAESEAELSAVRAKLKAVQDEARWYAESLRAQLTESRAQADAEREVSSRLTSELGFSTDQADALRKERDVLKIDLDMERRAFATERALTRELSDRNRALGQRVADLETALRQCQDTLEGMSWMGVSHPHLWPQYATDALAKTRTALSATPSTPEQPQPQP